MHRAAMGGHVEAVRALFEIAPGTASAQDDRGDTPMHWAAIEGHVEAVRALHEIAPETATRIMSEIGRLKN